MNERIRQIAMQAKLGPVLLLDHWGTADALTDSEQAGLQQLERFAELIVRECAAEADRQTIYCRGIPWGRWIKEHFGVEQ